MKKLITLLFAFTLLNLSAQQLIPYRVDARWGYADGSGKLVINPRYDKAGFFSPDGYARVSSGGHYTLIDRSGKEAMPFKYTRIFEFTSGMAPVCLGGTFNVIQGEVVDGKWGFINEKFEEVIPCQYARVDDFKGDYAIVQNENNWGSWGVIDKQGKVIVPFKTPSYSFDMRPLPGLTWDKKPGILRKDISGKGGRWQLVDLKGKPVGAPYYAMHGEKESDYPAEKIKTYVIPKGQIDILDDQGFAFSRKASECDFTFLNGDNFLIVFSDGGDTPKRLYGIISGNKTTIVPLRRYDFIDYHCSDGLVRVSRNDQYGYIDCTTGKEVISLKYSMADPFNEGLAYVAYNYRSQLHKGDGMINPQGVEFFKDSPAIHLVNHNGGTMIIDERNYLVEPDWMKNATVLSINNKLIRYLDSTNQVGSANLVADSIYTYMSWEDYCCRLYEVTDPTVTGVDRSGKRMSRGLQLSGVYDSAWFTELNEDIVFVMKNRKKGVVSITGKELVAPAYSEILPFNTGKGIHFCVSNEEGAMGIVNADGKVTLPVGYYIDLENQGYQIVSRYNNDNMSGAMLEGETLAVPIEYSSIRAQVERDEAGNLKNIIFAASKVESPILIDGTGKIVYNEKNVIIDESDDTQPYGIYYSLYKKKKQGMFKGGAGVILPLLYDGIELSPVNSKLYFTISVKKKYGIADANGKIIVPPVYSLIDPVDENGAIFLLTDKDFKEFYLTKEETIVPKKEE